ncbi:MAG: YhcN/YlaJ family sporulation lipoprotein [Clostridia bacterium]|nr:YhcN/YlaJ family sporulation lipoprotein [Clostridia bacterium]
MKRILLLTMLTLALTLMLTGCASNADATPTADPGGMGGATAQPLVPSNIPQATDQGLLGELGNTIGETLKGGSAALSSAEDALKASKDLRDAVQKLTEVDTAVAAAAGNTALVGVTFNSSYKGGIDERLQGMVLDRAVAAHPGIARVAVTSNADEIDKISALYQALQSGTGYATVKADLDALAAKLDLYQK